MISQPKLNDLSQVKGYAVHRQEFTNAAEVEIKLRRKDDKIYFSNKNISKAISIKNENIQSSFEFELFLFQNCEDDLNLNSQKYVPLEKLIS